MIAAEKDLFQKTISTDWAKDKDQYNHIKRILHWKSIFGVIKYSPPEGMKGSFKKFVLDLLHLVEAKNNGKRKMLNSVRNHFIIPTA